jgi:hypothetical protein
MYHKEEFYSTNNTILEISELYEILLEIKGGSDNVTTRLLSPLVSEVALTNGL